MRRSTWLHWSPFAALLCLAGCSLLVGVDPPAGAGGAGGTAGAGGASSSPSSSSSSASSGGSGGSSGDGGAAGAGGMSSGTGGAGGAGGISFGAGGAAGNGGAGGAGGAAGNSGAGGAGGCDSCCSDGIVDGDETDIDCGGSCPPCDIGEICGVGADCVTGLCDPATMLCVALADGAPCADAVACASGHCVDGVCCDDACGGACEACSAATKGGGADGACSPIAAGSDPDGECAAEAPSTCGSAGFCDGLGACQLYPAGTPCSAAACLDDVTSSMADVCDGAGTCVDAGLAPCEPYACDDTSGTCHPLCNTDSECAPAAYCLQAFCAPKKINGSPCLASSECQSGACVDNVCCDDACGGACEACSAARKGGGADGACGPIAGGLDPDNECDAQPPSTCGTTGTCNGSGACALHSAATICAPGVCQADGVTLDAADHCDGNGACVDGGTMSCAPAGCWSGTCFGPCPSDAVCPSSGYCDVVCKPKKPIGQTCGRNAECQSGSCVDGVCCDEACGGACEACSAARKGGGADGACGPIAAGTDPDNECAVQLNSTCGTTGVCNGSGACAVRPAGTQCAPPTCAADGTTAFPADLCDGNGTCVDSGAVSCGPGQTCASGACVAAVPCTGHFQCDPGQGCLGGFCVPCFDCQAFCTSGNDCLSGFCVDGVCCDSACMGPCRACTAAKKGYGTDQHCGLIAAGLDPDNECAAQPASTCGTTGTCDGFGSCARHPAGTVCAAATCTDATTLANPDTCDGFGTCVDAGTMTCASGVCDQGACQP